jgi:hypothetical protein
MAASTAGTISLKSATYYTNQNVAAAVTVVRTGGTSGAASVVCKSSNGTAVAGTDYTAVSTTLTWANGDATTKTCSIPVSDGAPFAGNKAFKVLLSGSSGAALGATTSATVDIMGNKGAGTAALSATAYSVAQSAGSIKVTVNRTGGDVGTSAIFYATANNTAAAGTDYTSTSGAVVWNGDDVTPKTITIPVSNSKPFSGSKTFALALAHAENVMLGSPNSAVVTINGSTSAVKPTVSLSASPTTVTTGSAATLKWSSTNASTCTASGAWSGLMPTSGSVAKDPASTSTYSLNCSGAGGSAAQSVAVQVAAAATSTVYPASCTGTSGPITLKAGVARASGISPLLVFFDATATTDSSLTGNTTAFQDITYTWNFGDSGTSGTQTWANGSNAGHNSRNTATGAVAAHLYVANADTSHVVTVTAHNGANSATCQLGVTAYNPAGANGFAGTKTTCVSASGAPIAGSGDCPAGAAVLNTSSFNTALGSGYFGSGRRVLFKCGDTFSGDGALLNGTTWSIGAYGGCENTKASRPIFHDPSSKGALIVDYPAGDGRITDIDFEGAGTGNAAVTTYGYVGGVQINYQITLYNLNSNGNSSSYSWAQGAQWGLIDSVMTGMRTSIGTFVNYNENNPSTWTGSKFNNVDYQAILGNLLNGQGNQTTGSGQEVLRVSACRLCSISNNTIENANDLGGVIKLHNGNTYESSPTWSGVYTELIEVSDNSFAGTSGGVFVDVEPQNNRDDERLRNIVFERNMITGSTNAWGGLQMRTAAVNETIRDNVFVMNSGGTEIYPEYAVGVGQLGIEPVPTGVEVYNNTIYMPTPRDNLQGGVAFNGLAMAAPPKNSYVKNNLMYAPSGTHTPVSNTGSGNTVSNNSASFAANPGFLDASGPLISDFKPSANYSGAVTVPVWLDALGEAWSTWYLGAVAP